MNAFQWANAGTIEDAVKLLKPPDGKVDPDEKPQAIGGGQDLLTSLKAYIVRPPRVINLKTIAGLDKIEVDDKGTLKIGATATITQLEENPQVKDKFPGLVEAAHSIATAQIRNLGTFAGNLATASPIGDERAREEHSRNTPSSSTRTTSAIASASRLSCVVQTTVRGSPRKVGEAASSRTVSSEPERITMACT